VNFSSFFIAGEARLSGTDIAHLHAFGFFSSVALSVKRLHDLNWSGWWNLPVIAMAAISLEMGGRCGF